MSTTNNPTTCPTGAVPEPVNLGINSTTVFAVVPRGNYTTDAPDDWMVSCCEPNTVQLASDGVTGTCWEWCDLPADYTNGTSKDEGGFMHCITSVARALNSSNPPSAVLVSSAAARDGAVGDGMFGLFAVLAVTAWRLFA